MGLQDQALEYTRQGWPVIPLYIPKGADVCNCRKGAKCPSIGKHPVPDHGLKEASISEKRVLEWWKKMPSANIGIRTGVDAGIFVLDVDIDEEAGKNGFATLADLEAKHGPLPLTRMAITGRGGRHYVFKHPGGDVRIKNSATTTLGNGLDVRGDGGYIVAPPSLHASGRNYAWENDLEPVDAPRWLIDMVKKRDEEPVSSIRPVGSVVMISDERARKYGLSALESAAREFAAVTKGGRNQELNRAAFKVAQLSVACGISEAMAEAVLLDAAAACGLMQEDGRDQCVKTFRSGWRQGLGKPREYTPIDREVPAPPKQRKPAPPAGDFDEDLVADYEARAEELADEDDDQGGDGDGYDSDGTGIGGEGPRPIIEIVAGELDRVVTEAEVALMRSGIHVYQRDGRLVRPIKQSQSTIRGIERDEGAIILCDVEEAWLIEAFTRSATFKRFDSRSGKLKVVDCPLMIARTYLARKGAWRAPALVGITESPTLRPDGSILEDPGYDRATGLLFNPGRTVFERIPEQPTLADAQAAIARLSELFTGFPFEDRHDLSIAIAAVLTGLVRRSISSAPLFAFNAPKMGSGKTLLANVVSLFATGRRAVVMTPVSDPKEEAKRLMAVLMEGDPVVCIDNISTAWASDAMCTVLTEETYKDRVLGVSKTASASTSVTWLATGNQISFVGDLTTRVMRCDLDPQMERPEERAFDVNLHHYIPEHRKELVPLALTILRAYHVAGRPKQAIAPYGRFEDWSNWVRSALVWADMADPCLCRADLEASDTVRTGLVAVLASWYDATGSDRVTAQNIIGLSRLPENQDLQAALMEVAGAGSEINSKRLGRWLARYEKRIEGGFRLMKDGEFRKAIYWKVVKTNESYESYEGSFLSTQGKTQRENVKSHELSETNSQDTQNSQRAIGFEEGDA